MIRINLLPYREERRKARRQQFYAMAGAVAVVGVVIVAFVYSAIAEYSNAQEKRNAYLKSEIASLNKQISQIKDLKEQTQALLARKNVIESLQQDRAGAVRLIAELTKLTPDGIYLKSIKQEGQIVSLDGYTQSNAKVSMYMKALEASPWFKSPNLIEIKAVDVGKKRLNEFTMAVELVREGNGADTPSAAGIPNGKGAEK